MTTMPSLQPAIDLALPALNEADVFASVERTNNSLRCNAMHVEVDCYYTLSIDDAGQAWVGWYSPDRWLSESIEADLVHTGDKIDELLAEEYSDQGLDALLTIEHFRNDDKVFVFRSPLDLPSDAPQSAELIVKVLLSYQACFLELGDMAGDEE